MTPKTIFLLSQLSETNLDSTQLAILQLLLEEMQNTQIINITEPQHV
jgi:hypothetical protein